jgi:hypothetical protein
MDMMAVAVTATLLTTMNPMARFTENGDLVMRSVRIAMAVVGAALLMAATLTGQHQPLAQCPPFHLAVVAVMAVRYIANRIDKLLW